jgi:hypothetical protein
MIQMSKITYQTYNFGFPWFELIMQVQALNCILIFYIFVIAFCKLFSIYDVSTSTISTICHIYLFIYLFICHIVHTLTSPW